MALPRVKGSGWLRNVWELSDLSGEVRSFRMLSVPLYMPFVKSMFLANLKSCEEGFDDQSSSVLSSVLCQSYINAGPSVSSVSKTISASVSQTQCPHQSSCETTLRISVYVFTLQNADTKSTSAKIVQNIKKRTSRSNFRGFCSILFSITTHHLNSKIVQNPPRISYQQSPDQASFVALLPDRMPY